MPTLTEASTRGRVARVLDDNVIVFKPTATSYELHLRGEAAYTGPLDEPLVLVIRLRARKIYTVPSGGNFVQPIFGPPRIVQGRVKSVNEREALLHAGANFVVELPSGDSAIDLNNGRLTTGKMVNVVAWPGATYELTTA